MFEGRLTQYKFIYLCGHMHVHYLFAYLSDLQIEICFPLM